MEHNPNPQLSKAHLTNLNLNNAQIIKANQQACLSLKQTS
jgi:hypothetical protein